MADAAAEAFQVLLPRGMSSVTNEAFQVRVARLSYLLFVKENYR